MKTEKIEKTVIGIDYGTQSARAVLVNTANGEVLCSHSVKYPHGVMEGDLASARDYEDALMELLAHVTPKEYQETVKGICVDATSLTLVSVDKEGRVLSLVPEYEDRLHAQIKLWKYHGAQAQADEALALAKEMQEKFLGRTGGTISCEWTLPKLLKIRDEDYELYQQIDAVFDLCEYLTYRLTGEISRSAGSMCFKGLWSRDLGFPSEAFLDRLRPGFAKEYAYLLRGEVGRPSDCVGKVREEFCEKFGLSCDVAVATGVLDGHTALVALGSLNAGDAALVVGTSNVLTIQTPILSDIEGICGIAMDGLTKGLYGIDSGQAGTGDMLEWYVKNGVPAEITKQAEEQGVSVHEILTAQVERPWENTVIAADWWNGSRNAPCDLSLPGIMSGLTLNTKAKDIYLALLQSIACGTREIIEQCGNYGIEVKRLLATGGITSKNKLLMHEYANLLHCPVYVGQVTEGPALGAAIFAAVAAGIYQTPYEAYEQMGVREFICYEPEEERAEAYETLYQKNHTLRKMAIQMKEM